MIELDASFGEGGGQILRSALALSVIKGRALRLTNIRAKRAQPGLKAQHLAAVRAAAQISEARVEGAGIGSQSLKFEPRTLKAGDYRFDIGTAGSVCLLLQTILLPLSLAAESSRVTLIGGTHVPWSPCYEFLSRGWLPRLRSLRFRAESELESAGFYPRGGGVVRAVIDPVAAISPLSLSVRGRMLGIRGVSFVARLPSAIAERQRRRAVERLEHLGVPLKIEVGSVPALSPGTFLFLCAEYEETCCSFSALGARGKPAERVADEACSELIAHHERHGAVEAHLADQLLLPLSLADGRSEFSTSSVSAHLLTNAQLLGYFLPAAPVVNRDPGAPGTVRVAGAGVKSMAIADPVT